jgi:hypothetical protein
MTAAGQPPAAISNLNALDQFKKQVILLVDTNRPSSSSQGM